MAAMLDLEENHVPAALVAVGGVSMFLAACLFWNVVYEDMGKDPGNFDANANAVNSDIFGLIVFAGLCAANVLTRHKGCAEVTLIGSTGALFYLFSGINAGGHQPWTSLGHVNMIRAWREDWDSTEGVSVPTWTKKALAAGIFAMMGYVLAYGAVVAKLLAVGDAGPLSEKMSPNRKAVLQVATIVTAAAAFIGCICVWATDVTGSPHGYGDLQHMHGPLYQPNKDEIQDMLTYGKNKDSRSTTEYDLYVLTMSITACTVLTALLTGAMMATTSRGIASVVTYLALANGWFFLTHASLFKHGVGRAMSGGDIDTVATGIVLCWIASMASLAASCIVHELHSGQSNRVGADQSSDPLNHLRNSFSTGARFSPLANNAGVRHERTEPRPSVDNLPKLKADVSPKPVKKAKPSPSPKPSPKVARKAKRAEKKATDDEKKAAKAKAKAADKAVDKKGEGKVEAVKVESKAEEPAKPASKPSPLAGTVETAAPHAANAPEPTTPSTTPPATEQPQKEATATAMPAATAVPATSPELPEIRHSTPTPAAKPAEPAAATDGADNGGDGDEKMEVSNL